MFVYWRIQQDLNCMGETICFKDPSFINQINKWVRKNIGGLMLVEEVSSGFENHLSINTKIGE